MGKRDRSHDLTSRMARLRKSSRVYRMKPPWVCPICSQKGVNYIEKRGFILIYCSYEEDEGTPTGEVMPDCKPYELIDYYNFWCDSRSGGGTIPSFISEACVIRNVDILKKKTTYGVIICR